MSLDELLVEDALVEALIDSQSYRTLAQQAIHSLHELQAKHDRQEQAYHRALDELRALRTPHEVTT